MAREACTVTTPESYTGVRATVPRLALLEMARRPRHISTITAPVRVIKVLSEAYFFPKLKKTSQTLLICFCIFHHNHPMYFLDISSTSKIWQIRGHRLASTPPPVSPPRPVHALHSYRELGSTLPSVFDLHKKLSTHAVRFPQGKYHTRTVVRIFRQQNKITEARREQGTFPW